MVDQDGSVTCFNPATFDNTPTRPIGYVELRGLGTGQIEALSGLSCRLAEKHWLPVGVFVDEVFHYQVKHTGIPIPKHRHMACHNVNGLGVYARRLVDALEYASDVHGFEGGTFLPWRNVFDERAHGLLKGHLHWCESCWLEDAALGETPYVRLLWTLQAVDICPHHMRNLSTFCPECGATQAMVPTLPRPWLCQKCGYKLFTEKRPVKLKEKANERKLWIINSLERLIERTCAVGYTIPLYSFSSALRAVVDSYSDGSVRKFSSSINIASRQIVDWVNGTKKPYISSFLEICYRLDVPPDSFLLDGTPLTDVSLWKRSKKPSFVTMNKLTKAEVGKISNRLRSIVEQPPEPPPLVSEVAESLGVTFTVLKYHFPDEYRIIKNRGEAWREHCRSLEGKRRIEALIAGVDELLSKGIFPGERQLKQLKYVRPSDLRRPEILTLLRELQSSANL